MVLAMTEYEFMELCQKAGFGGNQRCSLKVKLLLLAKLLGVKIEPR